MPETNNNRQPAERALVAHLAGITLGRHAALPALYAATALQIHQVAQSVLRCAHDSEEIVADVFIYVWRNSHRYDHERGTVMAWLAIITRHRAIDRLRTRRHAVSLDAGEDGVAARHLATDAEGPEQSVARIEAASTVNRVLRLQPPVRRRLITLAFYQGRCHEEIATTTGLPLGTIKSHIRRSLRQMRTTLEGRTDDMHRSVCHRTDEPPAT